MIEDIEGLRAKLYIAGLFSVDIEILNQRKIRLVSSRQAEDSAT